MQVRNTNLEGCFILEPTVFWDQRGYFLESFNKEVFIKNTGLNVEFVQDNQSKSTKGVLRGLHFQKGKYAQSKLIRVITGRILDVVVDIRPQSSTFGQHLSIELSDINKKQLFVPSGFAHGFVVLSEEAIVSYKCDKYYNNESEGGIIYNDRRLNIDWILKDDELLISEKDLILPKFDDL